MSPLHQAKIVDSHCHLDFPEFLEELDQVIERARQAGVNRMVTICTKPSKNRATLDIVEQYPEVYFAQGIHPHYAATEPKLSVDELLALSVHPKMIGIGESGLDYYYTKETAKSQQDSFLNHIMASQVSGLPLIVHSRNADEDMASILKREYGKKPFSCVMHCFSSGRKLAEECLEMGFYLSFSGILTFRSAIELQEIFLSTPRDKILIETDSPYLAPVPFRGKRNEPAFVSKIADFGASLLNLEKEAFAELTTTNFYRLFSTAG
ncbi:MAG: TatD family deoxyribonuclease [Rhodobacteraceae bacterium]|nr:TatD family deoxyribonuclease [Paracoccaceae bacterium]MYG41898.1 TatD family deoxyribonuclease [Paracoccaceae bacterium]